MKAVEAPYEAGRRGGAWLKVKPVHNLDLVVLAAEWGHGRRKGWLSNLHLGARDPANDGHVMLGKTFKGLTDELLALADRTAPRAGDEPGGHHRVSSVRSWSSRSRSTASRPALGTRAAWRCGSRGWSATGTTRPPMRRTPSRTMDLAPDADVRCLGDEPWYQRAPITVESTTRPRLRQRPMTPAILREGVRGPDGTRRWLHSRSGPSSPCGHGKPRDGSGLGIVDGAAERRLERGDARQVSEREGPNVRAARLPSPRESAPRCVAPRGSVEVGGFEPRVLERPTGSSPGAARW